MRDGEYVWLPAGEHLLQTAGTAPSVEVKAFNGNLEEATAKADGVEIVYNSPSRAFAQLSAEPVRLFVDGQETKIVSLDENRILLPPGRHTASIMIRRGH